MILDVGFKTDGETPRSLSPAVPDNSLRDTKTCFDDNKTPAKLVSVLKCLHRVRTLWDQNRKGC